MHDDRRKITGRGPRLAVFLAAQWRVHPGSEASVRKVKNPLTMIKGSLASRFSSIRQTDRMGYGSVT
jgi:hypothetical protein